MLAQFFSGNETRVKLAINMHFADATGDDVGVLGAEVEDGDLGAVCVAQLGGLFEVFWLFCSSVCHG